MSRGTVVPRDQLSLGIARCVESGITPSMSFQQLVRPLPPYSSGRRVTCT